MVFHLYPLFASAEVAVAVAPSGGLDKTHLVEAVAEVVALAIKIILVLHPAIHTQLS